ncbi:MAG: glyoxalase [Alphaproteobacteria bacterium]|nr:glyoxalase [Alphaproteobacteria bacterium]
MEQRVSIISLAAGDLERSTTFYESLGWHRSFAAAEGIAFFQIGGLAFSLYPRDSMARDIGVPADGSGFAGFALAHNTREKGSVDAVLQETQQAGGQIVRGAADQFWGGYAECLADPDGHLWEVAWNPHFPISENGSITLPD